MLSGLVGALSLPVECVVNILQCARVRQPCFLNGVYVYVESLEFLVCDSYFLAVSDVLKVFLEAVQHSPDIPVLELVSIHVFFVVAWCDGCDLLFGWFLIPMNPLRMTDGGGTAPYCWGLPS